MEIDPKWSDDELVHHIRQLSQEEWDALMEGDELDEHTKTHVLEVLARAQAQPEEQDEETEGEDEDIRAAVDDGLYWFGTDDDANVYVYPEGSTDTTAYVAVLPPQPAIAAGTTGWIVYRDGHWEPPHAGDPDDVRASDSDFDLDDDLDLRGDDDDDDEVVDLAPDDEESEDEQEEEQEDETPEEREARLYRIAKGKDNVDEDEDDESDDDRSEHEPSVRDDPTDDEASEVDDNEVEDEVEEEDGEDRPRGRNLDQMPDIGTAYARSSDNVARMVARNAGDGEKRISFMAGNDMVVFGEGHDFAVVTWIGNDAGHKTGYVRFERNRMRPNEFTFEIDAMPRNMYAVVKDTLRGLLAEPNVYPYPDLERISIKP